MKDANLAEQYYCDSTTFTLGNLRPKFDKQCLNVAPLDIGARWTGKNEFKRTLGRSLHRAMVPKSSTDIQVRVLADGERSRDDSVADVPRHGGEGMRGSLHRNLCRS